MDLITSAVVAAIEHGAPGLAPAAVASHYQRLKQAIAKFDTPKAAKDVVARTVDIWRRCGNDTLTFSYDGGKTRDARRMAVPSVLDGVDITHDEPVDVTDRITHRAILAVDNLVVDLRISGDDITDQQTVQLAKIIAGRNAL